MRHRNGNWNAELRRHRRQVPPRECRHRLLEPWREDDGGGDERHVEQLGVIAGNREDGPQVLRIPAGERGERNEQEVGEK